MRRIVGIVLIAVMCLSTLAGCGSKRSRADEITDNMMRAVEASDGAAMNVSLSFSGSVVQGNTPQPYIIEITGDGVQHKTPDVEQWRYDAHIEELGNVHDKKYDVSSALFGDSTVVSATKDLLQKDAEWTDSEAPSVTLDNLFFQSVLEHASKHAELKEDQTEYTVTSVLNDDALRCVLEATLNADHTYDFSGMKWSGKNAPVTILIDPTTSLPIKMTVNCKSVSEQIAECVSNRTGMRILVDSFDVTIEYDDWNIIKNVYFPEELNPTEAPLF